MTTIYINDGTSVGSPNFIPITPQLLGAANAQDVIDSETIMNNFDNTLKNKIATEDEIGALVVSVFSEEGV